MTETGIAKGATKPPLSGGFWRRFLAVVLDWLIVGTLVALIAVTGYRATDGLIRMASPPVRISTCAPAEVPKGFDPAAPIAGVDPALQARLMGDPAEFRPNQVTQCTVTLFGLELDRRSRVAQVSRDGNVTRSIFYDIPVNADGSVAARYVYLDNAIGPLLLVLLVLTEGLFGFSPGKVLVGLRVRRPDETRASPAAVVLRNGLLYGPFAVFSLFSTALTSGWIAASMITTVAGVAVTAVMVLWLIALLVGLIRGRPDPFWDVWSGTRVVRR